MQGCFEFRYAAIPLFILPFESPDLFLDGKKTTGAYTILCSFFDRPGYHDLITNILVHPSKIAGNRFTDIIIIILQKMTEFKLSHFFRYFRGMIEVDEKE